LRCCVPDAETRLSFSLTAGVTVQP
jgi:hypothetical protein